MRIIMDTSCIIGLIDRGSDEHRMIKGIVINEDNEIIIPSPVFPEVCYMLNKKFGSEVELNFIDELVKAELIVEVLEFKDVIRIPEITRKYQDLNIGFVDAAVTAIAERMGTNKILTLDNRHFNTIAPLGFDYFEILV